MEKGNVLRCLYVRIDCLHFLIDTRIGRPTSLRVLDCRICSSHLGHLIGLGGLRHPGGGHRGGRHQLLVKLLLLHFLRRQNIKSIHSLQTLQSNM